MEVPRLELRYGITTNTVPLTPHGRKQAHSRASSPGNDNHYDYGV